MQRSYATAHLVRVRVIRRRTLHLHLTDTESWRAALKSRLIVWAMAGKNTPDGIRRRQRKPWFMRRNMLGDANLQACVQRALDGCQTGQLAHVHCVYVIPHSEALSYQTKVGSTVNKKKTYHLKILPCAARRRECLQGRCCTRHQAVLQPCGEAVMKWFPTCCTAF